MKPFETFLAQVLQDLADQLSQAQGQVISLEVRLAHLELRNRVLEQRLESILDLTAEADQEGGPGQVPTDAILRAMYQAAQTVRARLH